MNYRHAFHAGNFADVMKHAVLCLILAHLARKESAFRVIDTHAGIGLYDLAAEEAERTGEAREGIGRLDVPFEPAVEAVLAPYRAVIAAVRERYGPNAYPGSPAILREMLRPQDRGVLAELHPEDAATLERRYNGVANLKVMAIDGWTALHAAIPPKERRGAILVDPPFEKPGELDRMGREILKAVAKWATGIVCAWYPIKTMAPVDAVAAALAEHCLRPGLRLELVVDGLDVPDRLNGCGLFVVNPPWTLAGDADLLLPALAARLSRAGYGAFRVEAFGPPA